MNLTGFFVEYLIIGSTSLLWLLPLLNSSKIQLPENNALIALLAPCLYVLGMIIDVAGHYITLFHRRRINKKANAKYKKKYGFDAVEHTSIEAELFRISPEIAKAAAARTSRARVSRGTLTNALIMVPTWLALLWPTISIECIVLFASTGTIAILALWGIWARWQRLVYRFEMRALPLKEP